ncbi:MAG: exopolysaccharide biosynthesis protein [Alphaproteobacteria bacterium]|nr:exopolysaccharide biosynthesis protein [Alphaproteobacteria bacterium]MBU1606320.1 exopolysaccharide biosynthesis protein [Alphaproteobacteria bacterium]
MTHEPHNVSETVETLEDLASGAEEVLVADVLREFGKRSFGPFLLVPALIEMTIGGIVPGVPTLLALIIALVAVQQLLGRDHVWLPQVIQRRSVGAKKLMAAAKKLEGVAAFLDRMFKGRLERFTGPRMQKLAAVVVVMLCCTVPPLELVPFASSAPMVPIAAFGLAILVRDGLVMLVALTLSALAVGLGGYFWFISDTSGSILPF